MLIVAALLINACRSRPDDAVLRYLQLSVALGERDPDSIDYYFGPAQWVADIRGHPPTLPAIKQAALELSRQLQSSNTPSRDFLIKQLNAIAARADLAQGIRISFDDQARLLFDLEPAQSHNASGHSDIRGAEVRRELDHLLPGNAPLAKRYAEYDRRFLVPSERLPAVMDRAIQGCRERTLQRVKLPRDESISVEYVRNEPWNAYSFYQGKFHSVIRINTDFPLTVDRIFELACHEAYPGHHTFNALVDSELVQRQHHLELMVQPTFSPQSFSSEALASYAPEIAFSDDERLEFERNVLFPLAGLPSQEAGMYFRISRLISELDSEQLETAREYIEGRLEWSRAAAALEDRALMAETEATLKYFNEFGSYVLAYTLGKEVVKGCFAKTDIRGRWILFDDLALDRESIRDCSPVLKR